MKDYEQLYYDSLYEIKQLKNTIKYLENDLIWIKKTDKKKIEIKKEIMKELYIFKNKVKGDEKSVNIDN